LPRSERNLLIRRKEKMPDAEAGSPEEEVKKGPAWHAMTKAECFKELGLPDDIRKKGLTTAQAAERLAKYGPNKLSEKEARTLFAKIYDQLANVLVGILIFVAVVSAYRAATNVFITNFLQVVIIVAVLA
jgi:P-type Ca2+ transporter type 2C